MSSAQWDPLGLRNGPFTGVSFRAESWWDPDLTHEPAAAAGTVVAIPLGTLTLSGFAPVIVNPKSALVPLVTLTLSGFAPTVKTPRIALVPLGTLTLTDFAPSIRVPRTLAIPLGTLTLSKFTPAVVITGGAAVVPVALGTLTLSAFVPVVVASGGLPPSASEFIIRSRRRLRR